jgi:hypothetical protein
MRQPRCSDFSYAAGLVEGLALTLITGYVIVASAALGGGAIGLLLIAVRSLRSVVCG